MWKICICFQLCLMLVSVDQKLYIVPIKKLRKTGLPRMYMSTAEDNKT